jgi:hypothetical protein
MATAVLSGRADVLEGVGREVWSDEEDHPNEENFFEDLARRWRQKGYNAVAVCDGSDGSKIKKYINPETGRVWTKDEYEKKNKLAVK